MKKVVCILSVTVMLFMLCIPCFADMDSPTFLNYAAYVSNQKGAKTLNFYHSEDFEQEIIPYQTKVKVTGEAKENGVIYAHILYNDNSFWVSTADLAKSISKVDKSQAQKFSKTYKKVVIAKNGVAVYDGPAESYKKIGSIPYGTTISFNYGTEENGDAGPLWAYVTYGKVSGWILSYEFGEAYNCATVLSSAGISAEIMQDGYYLYELPSDESKKITGQLPVGTKLSYKYEYNYAQEVFVFVEYKSIKGWLSLSNGNMDGYLSCAVETDTGVYVNGKNGTKLYEKVTKDRSGKVLTVIPNGELLNASRQTTHTVSYYEEYYFWYYVRYKNYSGWVCEESKDDIESSCVAAREYRTGKINKRVDVYSKPEVSSKKIGTAPAGASFEGVIFYYDGSEYYYVKINNMTGWMINPQEIIEIKNGTYDGFQFGFLKLHPVSSAGSKTAEIEANSKTSEESVSEESTTDIDLVITEEPSVTENIVSLTGSAAESETEKSGISTRTIIIGCLCAAIILALTGLVVVILINKKKAQSNPESPDAAENADVQYEDSGTQENQNNDN
ncbi:MAG: SH3 domain-containing protein [Clostridia bacterium]|nr:SH3 domain-containing protein [Clostridia bacterium]